MLSRVRLFRTKRCTGTPHAPRRLVCCNEKGEHSQDSSHRTAMATCTLVRSAGVDGAAVVVALGCRNQHGHCVWLLVPRRSSPVSAVRSTRYRPTTCFVRGCRRQRHCVHPSVQEKSTPQIPVSEPHFLRLINNFLNRTRPISPIFYCKQISWFL
jgi:hypothetical protein